MPSGGGGSGVVLPVAIAQGGTGQITAGAALTALGGIGPGSHTLKRGSAAGNYTTSSASFGAIDDTNLKVTVTVPTGQIAFALFIGSVNMAAGASGEVGIAVDGTVAAYTVNGGFASDAPSVQMAVLVGDGASHTFAPQWRVTSGGHTFTMENSGESANAPIHLVLLIGAS